jgi:hypothetical protein
MPTTLTIAELLNYFFGSTTLISIIIAWKSRKSSIKQAEATALEGVDAIYQKMIAATDKKFAEMDKEIANLKQMLTDYITQCSTSENNKIIR